jgi:membrane-associated phospholipid phosphatase
MVEPKGDEPIKKIEDAAQQAAANETAPAPIQHRRSVLFYGALLLLLVAFAGLTVLVTTTSTSVVDLFITHTLQAASNPVFSTLMVALSWPGYPPQAFIIPPIIVLLLYGFGLRWEALCALAAGLMEAALDMLVKDAIHRARPPANLVHVFVRLGSYSFPSGHVTFYTGFFGFIWFLAFVLLKPSWKRTLLLTVFGALIVLIGVSRIYLGEHWASDVLGGYLLGTLTLVASIQLYRWGKANVLVRQPVAESKERA